MKFALLLLHLDERQRRLALAAEASTLGRGGITAVARAAGVSTATVARGMAELAGAEQTPGRARRPGGGRKQLAKADAGLRPALLALLEPAEPEPMRSPLRWTTKPTRQLAAELARAGHKVSPPTVAALLRKEDFGLHKETPFPGLRNIDRGAQFRYLNGQLAAHLAIEGLVIHVQTVKRTMAKAGGGLAAYSGGQPNAADDRDSATVAVAAIRAWWHQASSSSSGATRLLIAAGGNAGYRSWPWQAGLTRFAAETGLVITVCHVPPGTSKWQHVVCRLSSCMSLDGRDQPAIRHEVSVQEIAVDARDLSQAQASEPNLCRHDVHGQWNYTIMPD